MSFAFARSNFYHAAKEGSEAVLMWLDGKTWSVTDLVINELLPKAAIGLSQLGISQQDSDEYLNIIRERAITKATGGNWQTSMMKQDGMTFQKMMLKYIELQNSNQPVHQWPVDRPYGV